MLDMQKLEDMLTEEVQKHDSEVRYWAEHRFSGGGARLEDAEKSRQLAQDTVDCLQRCRQLQQPGGNVVSALRCALSQLQAIQKEAPASGKKRKGGADAAK